MPSRDAERGLSRERTGLAWERSAGTFGALAAVVLGVAAHRDAPGLIVPSAALVLVGAAVWRHGRQAYERADVAPQAGALGLMTLAVALAAVAAAIVVVVTR